LSVLEQITLGVLATTAITGTIDNVTDRQLRWGLRLLLQQAERGELPHDHDIAIATRRAQMLALELGVRAYERLPRPPWWKSPGYSRGDIAQPLSRFIRKALLASKLEGLDRPAQASVIKQMEAVIAHPESLDGAAHDRQRALRRLAEDWTLAEARARIRNAKDWPRFEKVVREGGGENEVHAATPAWWDAFRAFMADEIRSDMRLAAILAQKGLADLLGNQSDLKAVLAHMSKGRERWVEAMAPALAEFRSNAVQMTQSLERFDQTANAIERIESLIKRATKSNQQAILLSDAGRREEALAATAEAVDLHRELVAKAGNAHLPDLAGSLINLGNHLSDAGRSEEALAAGAEAVDCYRELAAKNRDAYAPDLARLLNTLGDRRTEAGRRDEGLSAISEAVDLRRELVAKNREAFLPDLAASLNNLSHRLFNADRHEEALAASAEAVDLRRELVAANADEHAASLARACGSRGRALRATHRFDEALASFKEGVETLNPLMPKYGAALRELYVSLVNELIATLQATGRHAEAVALQAHLRRP